MDVRRQWLPRTTTTLVDVTPARSAPSMSPRESRQWNNSYTRERLNVHNIKLAESWKTGIKTGIKTLKRSPALKAANSQVETERYDTTQWQIALLGRTREHSSRNLYGDQVPLRSRMTENEREGAYLRLRAGPMFLSFTRRRSRVVCSRRPFNGQIEPIEFSIIPLSLCHSDECRR